MNAPCRLALLATLPPFLAACSSPQPGNTVNVPTTQATSASPATASTPLTPAAATPATPTMPANWSTWRVGGDLFTKPEFREDSYYSGKCSITTPLPEGYPAPTPPGAIELKRYPTVRRAEMSMDASKNISSQSGRNLAFWPLFNHIQKREIAMTSPVEMNYPQMKIDSAAEAKSESQLTSAWTMSFLYRTTDMGPLGDDGKVQVVDVAPMTVLSIGMMGPYLASRDIAALDQLRTWLAANPQWRAAGPARSLYYNGPDVIPARQWSEMQVPIEPAV
jgi:hypothetical protein